MNPVNSGQSTPLDDIPEALRDPLVVSTHVSTQATPWTKRWPWLMGGLGLSCISLGVVGWSIGADRGDYVTVTSESGIAPVTLAPLTFEAQAGSTAIAGVSNLLFTIGDETIIPSTRQRSLLGHRYYAEVNSQSLVSLTADGRVKLRPAAAAKVQAMLRQAQRDGVALQVVSGFRSEVEQRYLFFELSAHRSELPTQRAEVSAPPGYSEHHTGYAVDFIDASQPQTDLEVAFATTPAFRWLEANAARYGFELSFPQDNTQGLAYEPWHWRFVGDRDSLETFYQTP